MTAGFVIAGTDTGVGKTVFSAALTAALGAFYWKPVQAGLEEETDSSVVARLADLPPGRLVPEAYRLQLPASPHLAAKREGLEIRAEKLPVPKVAGRLIIEGVGGLLVPLSYRLLQIDLFAAWALPVILCARTSLGTINHTLLSLEAMRRREMTIQGVVFIGDEERDVEGTICECGRVRRLGRLPWVDPLTANDLREAFREGFRVEKFFEEPQG